MSTFGGLNTALSGLNAARIAMETAGNNLANVGTTGYTRQRAEFAAAGPLASSGVFATKSGPGQGTVFTGIARLADAHLDARVRGSISLAAQSDTSAAALDDLQSILREPGENGLSSLLNDFWAGWEEVANSPGDSAPAVVLLERANAIAERVSLTRSEISDQFEAQHRSLRSMVDEVNTATQTVAELNAQIRSVLASGGSANSLMDQRDLYAQSLAELTGASLREQSDGTVDLLVDGNPIVSGTSAFALQVGGSTELNGDIPPRVEFAHRPGQAVALQGGRMAGTVALLAPADSAGTGGALAEALASLDSVASQLATRVNEVQAQGLTTAGNPGAAFFSFAGGKLSVLATGAQDLATRSVSGGALDGSNALSMADIANESTGPDALWTKLVVGLGAKAKSAAEQAVAAGVAAHSAVSDRFAASAVSIDEENVSLIANQHAFQGAARVMTAIDEMLDTLINRTGLVGR